MIKISQPYIEQNENFAYLKANVIIPVEAAQNWLAFSQLEKDCEWKLHEDYPPKCWENDDFYLYFMVDINYAEDLCHDRSDAFVVALIYYAMVTGEDIMCDAPVSERLLYNLNHTLIPMLCNEHTGFKRIKIIASAIKKAVPNKGAVATGMSCGVDSFATFVKHLDENIPDDYRLTHITYFDMGAVFRIRGVKNTDISIPDLYDKFQLITNEKIKNAQQVSKMSNIPLVTIKSNLDIDLYRGNYNYTAIYRNVAMAMSLQGLFEKYIHSTAGLGYDKGTGSLRYGSQENEILLLSCFSNRNIDFILGCPELTRFEKTSIIANNPIVQRFLDTCWNFEACGTCDKCYRTLITLDLLNNVDKYRETLNVDYFNRYKDYAYGWLINAKNSSSMTKEIFQMAKAEKRISFKSYLIYYVYVLLSAYEPLKHFVKRRHKGKAYRTKS